MNRLAVVLAADSATTVTSWISGEKEERYFKGANKVYQLSNNHPIGIMIFDTASLLRVPWEVIIKDFRKELGVKSHNYVSAYADEFFKFIVNNVKMFPPNIQHGYVVNAASGAAFGFMASTNLPEGLADLGSFYDKAIQDRIDELRLLKPSDAFPDEQIQRIRTAAFDDIKSECEKYRLAFLPKAPTHSDDLAELGILEIARHPNMYLETTGIVFAGFGDDDIFPCMEEYAAYGLIAGQFHTVLKSKETIDHETPASLTAFAQTSMADTFTVGFGLDAYISFNRSISDGLKGFAKEICGAVGADIANVADLEDRVTTKVNQVIDEIMTKARQDHALPLRRVLGALPVDEMADLAETLINLQSLKEKVTKPSASVGGPVDVAVITRSEGLIWIRRKHFFDPSLNIRYMQRQAALAKGSS